MFTQKASMQQLTAPADLHAEIQAMIAAAQGAPMPPQAAPMAPPPPAPAMPAPAPAGPPSGAPAPAMPQAGGSAANIQKSMMARAIRGG